MGFLSIVSPITNDSVRHVLSPVSNEGVRDWIYDHTIIGNPTIQKISLHIAAVAAQAFLPPGVGTAVAQVCKILEQKVGDKQAQEAALKAGLQGLPADQQAQAMQYMNMMNQMVGNPQMRQQLMTMLNATGQGQTPTAAAGMGSLKMPARPAQA